MRNLDLDALRCFVMGVELGSFSLAAQKLNRSSSAASAQLKKLEQQCNKQLVTKVGRNLKPTSDGEIVLSYARRIIQLNDEAMFMLNGKNRSSVISFGLHEEFSQFLLPKVLCLVNQTYPGIKLESTVGRYGQLKEGILSKDLDFTLCWEGPEKWPHCESLGSLGLSWYGPKDFDIRKNLSSLRPIPLVMLDKQCLIYQQTTRALDYAGIPWHVSFVGQSLNSLWQAVSAGFGITVRTSFDLPSDLIKVEELPKLGDLKVSLKRNQNTLSEEKQVLYEYIRNETIQHIQHIQHMQEAKLMQIVKL